MSEIINNSLKTAVKGSALVFFGMVSSILLWFSTKILIARYTTKEEFGLYSLSVAIVGIFSIIAMLGLHEGIARYVSIYIGEGRRSKAEAIAGNALIISFFSSLFLFSLLFFSAGILSKYIFYKADLEAPLMVISLFIPFSVTAAVMGGILRGHNIFLPKVYADIGQPLLFLLLLGLSLVFQSAFLSIIYSYVVSMVITSIVIGYCFFKRQQINFVFSTISKTAKELLSFSLPILIASVLGLVLGWADTLMLGRYTKAEDVGIYNISISLAKLLTFPLSAISFALMPVAGELYAKRQINELGRTYQILTKWIFSATFPIFFILFFFPEMTIIFLFGERFIEATISLRILSVCFLFHAFLGANGVLLMVMGMSRTIMNISLFGVVLNIVLNYLLIKKWGYGITGASFATLTSYIALNVMTSWVVYKKEGIHPFTPEYIKPVASSAFIGIIIYFIAKSLPLYFWMLPIYLFAFASFYLIGLIVTNSIDKEDIMLLSHVLQNMGIKTGLAQKIYEFCIKRVNINRR